MKGSAFKFIILPPPRTAACVVDGCKTYEIREKAQKMHRNPLLSVVIVVAILDGAGATPKII